MGLTAKVLWAMILGILLGAVINLSGLNVQGSRIDTYVIEGLFDIVGKMFIAALKMLVVPLVFFSLVSEVIGIGDVGKLGKVGVKSLGLYLLTTALAVASAIGVAMVFAPDANMGMIAKSAFSPSHAPSLAEVLIHIIPDNIIQAFASGNMLQIIFFSILLGISLLMVGRKAIPIAEGIKVLNEAMMQMVGMIMRVAPFAVFALLAKAVSQLGFDLLANLAGYVAVLVLALHLFGTLMLVLKCFAKLSPKIFLKKIRDVQLFAFSTSSSNATIPVTLQTVTKHMGADNSVASFTIPFGATINMDGTAIMQGVATVFIANVYGVELGISGYLTVIVMSVLASIGTAGVPGVGLVMLSMVFVQVGLPLEGIGLILGVDRLLDMLRTVVNVTGDAVVTCLVARTEGVLNEQVFVDSQAGLDNQMLIQTCAQKELSEAITHTKESPTCE